jgi:hypothetical protein
MLIFTGMSGSLSQQQSGMMTGDNGHSILQRCPEKGQKVLQGSFFLWFFLDKSFLTSQMERVGLFSGSRSAPNRALRPLR